MWSMSHHNIVSAASEKWKENKQANKYSCVNANVDSCLATDDYKEPQWKRRCSRLVN